MKMKTVAAVAASTALALGGCASIGAVSQGQAPTVAEVQADTQAACAFLPTAAAISAILTKNSQSATANQQTGAQLAQIICSSVVSAQASSASSAPAKSVKRKLPIAIVNGVVVHGTFVDTGAKI